ncbi:hypothetical protein SLS62_002725 [Diatrype stigma]|uniref:Glycoprotease family protein n=1 Tax=Diatrype stigma TaxID=117547 RepID=A0AAN9UTY8_9PEZI
MPTTTNPFATASADRAQRDDWEDWEDDDSDTGAHTADLLVDLSDATTAHSNKYTSATNSQGMPHRFSVQKPMRVKSKGRQKAQNAKAGIKLVTDMTKFRRSELQQQQAQLANRGGHNEARGKFVDTAALLALEGEPTSASVGSFSWLKRKPGNLRKDKLGKKATRHTSSDLSPAARPIVIGISVPSEDLSSHQVSPQTAVLETPLDVEGHSPRRAMKHEYGQAMTPQQQRSVWSPDTEESDSPYSRRTASSIFSQQPSVFGGSMKATADTPPVPTLPDRLRSRQLTGAAVAEAEDQDDVDTPCTLFEEDGSPLATRKSYRSRGAIVSPDSAATSRSHGWWDHITTPFAQSNPFRLQAQETASSSLAAPQDWWNGADEKKAKPARASGLTILTPSIFEQRAEQSTSSSSRNVTLENRSESHAEKAQILQQENEAPSDEPPPYSPPKAAPQVKYQAILPPSHSYNPTAIPSPGIVSPGLSGTMTSQGAIKMSDIPLSTPEPSAVTHTALPDRPVGAYVVGDHFLDVSGTNYKPERQRRRHEKEEAVARKAGGFWRGRGCIPADGCFGRTGREGRQRRRVCLGIFGGVLAAIILIVVLVVILTRKGSPDQPPEPSFWLNLTDFPPMPTGVLTVSGPDNTKAVSGCLENSTETAWTCSLPKEEQDSVFPFLPNQPEFIFQIQYDNDTRALWNVSEAQSPDSTEDSETERDRRSIIAAPGITPIPDPPSTAEISFLGNTTDKIELDNKAGEPTPFYISLLSTVDETIGPDTISRRQGFNNAIGGSKDNGTANSGLSDILPAPVSNPDGTGAAARLFPLAKQQPLRLFDRGLATEHYGFYTYFDKRTYLTDNEDAVSADKDGGSRLSEAHYVVTFTQTRFLVQMWTRRVNTTALLGNGTTPGTDGTSDFALPGTMPYPITVTEDMHGGDSTKKMSFYYGVDRDQQINTTQAGLITINKKFDGTIVNELSKADPALGGVDGGTGGCRCEWQNFRTL